jgi:proline dehydrogenase
MDSKKYVDFDNLEVAFASKNDRTLKKVHFIFFSMGNNAMVKIGTALTKFALSSGLPVKGIIKSTIFDIFCGGEDIDECQKTADQMSKFGIGAILDYSVEGEVTEAGFESTTKEILRTIECAGNSKHIPFGAFKVTGIGSSELLTKVQAKVALTDDEEAAYQNIRTRVDSICSKAFELGVKVLIDAEESWFQDPIDEMAYEMMEKYNREKALIFNTYQMYRHESIDAIKNADAVAREKGYLLGAKLVRGAYMEKERERALENNYPSPIQVDKKATDRDYDLALRYCIENITFMSLFNGSHNEQSNYTVTHLIEEHGLDRKDDRVWSAQLYGMSDNISYNMANVGFNVAKYLPYGPIKASMPYLFRRAEENTSVKGQSGRELLLVKREIARRKDK